LSNLDVTAPDASFSLLIDIFPPQIP